MPSHTHGRRTGLIGLIAALAFLAFSSSAMAITVSLSNQPGAAASVTPPVNRTEDRNATIKVTVGPAIGAYTATCTLDGVSYNCTSAIPANAATTYSFPSSPLSLGVHKFSITVNDAGPPVTSASDGPYVWRIEPPQYKHLVTKASPGSNAYAYWPLDDAPGITGSSADDASLGGTNDGYYRNFVVQRQPALTKCEEQPGAPHSPWACDWAGQAPDSVGQLLDPVTNSPSAGGGRDAKGYSVYVDGGNGADYVDFEMPTPTVSGLSVDGWVKPAFTAETRGIFQYRLYVDAYHDSVNNQMIFRCYGANDSSNAATSAPIADGAFSGAIYHLACTYSGGKYYLYVNNVKTSSFAGSGWDPNNNGGTQGYIGWTDDSHGWKGYLDNFAWYSHALSDDDVSWHYQTGAIQDSKYGGSFLAAGEDQAPPSQSAITTPSNFSQYSKDAQGFKAPKLDFSCVDVDNSGANVNNFVAPDTDTNNNSSPDPGDCFATVDGTKVNRLTALPLGAGMSHTVILYAEDAAGNLYTHTHTYYVYGPGQGYQDLITCTNPLSFTCTKPLAYYRLNEASGASTMVDSGPNGYNGDFKNDQDQGGTGVSGDVIPNKTRKFFGQGGYAAVNNISAPLFGYTMELWWQPSDDGDMMLMQHGSNGALYYKGGKVYFRPDERSTSTASVAVPTPSAAPNYWYFVAATYDGIVGKLYVQKSDGATTTLPSAATTLTEHWQDGQNSADTLYLGYGDQLGGTGWLRGSLDEVAYYDSVLSAGKLTEHYNADPPAGDVRYAKPKLHSAKSKAHKSKAKAKAKARAKAKAKAMAKLKAKAKAKARAKAKAKARARAHRRGRA